MHSTFMVVIITNDFRNFTLQKSLCPCTSPSPFAFLFSLTMFALFTAIFLGAIYIVSSQPTLRPWANAFTMTQWQYFGLQENASSGDYYYKKQMSYMIYGMCRINIIIPQCPFLYSYYSIYHIRCI